MIAGLCFFVTYPTQTAGLGADILIQLRSLTRGRGFECRVCAIQS
jgi:hypothetical protein